LKARIAPIMMSEKASRPIAIANGSACDNRVSGPAKLIPAIARIRTNGTVLGRSCGACA
jgi:hypothetical protein